MSDGRDEWDKRNDEWKNKWDWDEWQKQGKPDVTLETDEADGADARSKFENEMARAEKLLRSTSKLKLKKKHSAGRAFALVSQLGLQMAVCIALGVMLGVFLDRWLGVSPLFIIIGAVLGAGGAIKIIYDIAKDWDD